jgi:hypothetical protein
VKQAFFSTLILLGVRTHRQFRLVLRALALIAGLVAAFYVSVLVEENEYEIAFRWYLLVVTAAFLEFVVADVLADRSFPFDTERKLSLMERQIGSNAITAIATRLQQVISGFRGCDTLRISGTVHVKVELSSTAEQRLRFGLLQLTDYVGREGGKKGRITLINQGVIGRCARTGEPETVDFADANDYAKAMVREFGFTAEEAERHTKTGRSYLAYPLTVENKVIGVIYFFSTEPQVFPRAVRQDQLKDLAREILNYVRFAGIA